MTVKRASKDEGDKTTEAQQRCEFTERLLLAMQDDMRTARDAAERVRVHIESLMREHEVAA